MRISARKVESARRGRRSPIKNWRAAADSVRHSGRSFVQRYREFARQWVILGRREAYEPGSGLHRLTMVVSGSTGQSGSWALDIDEGRLDVEFGGRRWDVMMSTTSDAAMTEANMRTQAAKEKTDAKERVWEDKLLHALDKLAGPDGIAGKNAVRDAAGLNTASMARAMFRWVDAGAFEEVEAVSRSGVNSKVEKRVPGLRRKSD